MYRKGEGAITRAGDGRGMVGEAAVLSPRTTTTLTPEEEAEWRAREYAAYLALKRGEPVRYRAPGEKVGRPFFYKRRPVSYKVTRAEPAEEALVDMYRVILASMEDAERMIRQASQDHLIVFMDQITRLIAETADEETLTTLARNLSTFAEREAQYLEPMQAKLRLEYFQTLRRVAAQTRKQIEAKTLESLSIKNVNLANPIRPQMEERVGNEALRLIVRGNQRLDRARQESLGINNYIWRTRDDARVRHSHDENDDRVFSWDNPPPTGHPGEDFGCRCRAEAILENIGEPRVQVAALQFAAPAAIYIAEANTIFATLAATAATVGVIITINTPDDEDEGEDEGEGEEEGATPPLPDLTQPDQDPDEDPDEDGEEAPPEGRTDLEWELGEHKTPEKWSNQMRNRQWTEDEITNTIKNGRRFNAPNKVNPNNNASRYQLGNRFVIRDEVTKQILQVSGDGFIPN